MDRIELKDKTANLPNPCYVQCGDNLEILKSKEKYWISNMGVIISKNGSIFRIKKQSKTKSGYLSVKLCSNYKFKSFLVHRLVVSHFIGEYTEKLNATNHKNSIRTDNRSCNLEICDYAYNNKYAYDNGYKKPVSLIGASNPQSQPVIQLDLFGQYISEFVSIKEAMKKIGLLGGFRIYKIGGKLCSNKGFVFMLKNEYESIKKDEGSIDLPNFRRISTNKRSIVATKELIKVVQLDDCGKPIEIFDNYKDAELKIGKKGVLDVCRKRIHIDKNGKKHQYLKCGGYKWMYYDDYCLKQKNSF